MANSRPPLLVFADDWGRHASSCQHLIRRLTDRYRILWVNSIGTRQVKANGFTLRRGFEKLRNWSQGVRQVDTQMWVLDLPMLPTLGTRALRTVNRRLATQRLRAELAKLHMESPIVLTTLPYMPALIPDLPRRALVYYCTDDYSHWPTADRDVLHQADAALTRDADLILAASRSLHTSHNQQGRCHYFPHGVDFHHFASAPSVASIPAELARLPQPRIGFFGLIYEQLDFNLLRAVAERFTDVSVVMIGRVDHCPESFRQINNVHFLGPKPYAELPKYLAGLDVLLLPYRDDPMIRQSGPLKLRECLATGKPTVSIDVPEVRLLEPHVKVASDLQEFLLHVQSGLAEGKDSRQAVERRAVVAMDSWEARADTLDSLLQTVSQGNCARLAPARAIAPRRRVLHLRTVSGKGGGPEKTLLNSPRFLADSYQLKLAYIRPENDRDYDMPERARRMDVDLLDIPERGPADPRTFWRLVQAIREFQPHILHAHDYKTDALAVLLGKWFRIPAVTTLHGFGLGGGRLEAYYQIDRWALQRMDHVIVVSDDLREQALRWGVAANKLSLIENAIDTHQYQRRQSTETAKRRLGVPADRFVIGAVGRLCAEKGFDHLIAAVESLLDHGVNIELLIVGEGEERPKLEQQRAQSAHSERFRLLGHQSDPLPIYEAMDCFVLSSLREAMPNALLEALAMEVPVIATNVGGVPRLIQHRRNGVLIEPAAPVAIAGAITEIIQDMSLMDQLRRAGRVSVEQHFSFAVRMRKVRAVYDALLSARNTVRARPQIPATAELTSAIAVF